MKSEQLPPPPTMLTYYKRMNFNNIFNQLANIVGTIIIVIVTGIILIALLTALAMKVEDFLFGKSTTHQVEEPSAGGVNKVEDDVVESTKINEN